MSPVLAKVRKRLAPLLLALGVVVAALVVVPQVPKERTVVLRLGDAASVTGVDVTWSPAEKADGEAIRGAAYHYPAGRAPAEIIAPVHLPDGRYALDVTVERGAGRDTFHRVITLGAADRIAVSLR